MVVIKLLNGGNKVIKWITRSEVSMWSVGYSGIIILILVIVGIILLIKNLNKKK